MISRLRRFSLLGKISIMVVSGVIAVAGGLGAGAFTAMMSDAHQSAAERQESDMRVAWDVLLRYGDAFHAEGDKLYVGQQSLNGFEAPVDRIKALVGGAATIFLGDTRVATNVTKPDGDRAVGTKLPPGPIYDEVLGQGRPYRGTTSILGIPYFAAYDPILGKSGKAVGILFVGTPQAAFMQPIWDALERAALIGVLVASSVLAVCLLTTRRLLQPLHGLHRGMAAMAAGETELELPGLRRGDEVGDIARAVEQVRQRTIQTLRDEAAAAEQVRLGMEAERTRNEAERARAAAEQVAVVDSLASSLARLSTGDLTCELAEPFAIEYERLRTDFNDTLVALRAVVCTIVQNTDAIRSGTGEISQAADDLSRRTEQQAASLEQTAAALDEITATVCKTAEGARVAQDVVGTTKGEAVNSEAVMQDAVAAMDAIDRSSREIGQIIGVVDEIAFQTNLLALNAGVEAARAGDAGRGFAVVASEVRALAQRSASAAKEIKGLVGASSSHVGRGVALVSQTGKALGRMLAQVNQVESAVAEIAASAREQASGLAQVNIAVNQMDQITQQNAAMVQQSTAASRSLADDAVALEALTARFNVGTAGPTPATPVRLGKLARVGR